MPASHPVRPRRDSGYAILMIFLVAAILGLMLYQAMPRVAFESERDKEQLLIDRGEQYKRAIQLYYRKTQRYPVKMEDLEKTNNIRFLRQRYADPMTGKSEWRLIHVGAGGVFTDSLTQKKTDPNKKAAAGNTFVTEEAALGAASTGASDTVNPGLRRRPSDGAAANPGSDSNLIFPPDPNAQSNETGVAMGGGALPNTGYQANSAYPNEAGLPGPGNSVAPPGAQFNAQGNPQFNGQPQFNGMPPGATPYGPGATPNGTNAAAMIGQMLTGPRPGGPPPGIFSNNAPPNGNQFPQPQNPVPATGGGGGFNNNAFGNNGIGTTGNQNGGAGQILAGSFAGVASTAERPGIKIYNDHHKYNEWEFIYDYSKDIAKAAGLAVPQAGQQPANPFQPGAQPQPGASAQPQQPQQPQQPTPTQ